MKRKRDNFISTQDFPSQYNPKNVDKNWYGFWEDKDYFNSMPDRIREPFVIVIPPPNITGVLHMGHALNNTLQDIIIRRKRMQGFNTLWLPGTDHGGIATQNIVEKELAKKGLKRDEMTREEFLHKMWEWRREFGNTIIEQLKRLGCSCDWGRLRFTMDEELTDAVLHAFVVLYKKGLIYRGEYMVNWCIRCRTALADIEVEHTEEKGKLWYIRYPLQASKKRDKLSGYITVATTRPETMLGDTAVAVNPKDTRFKGIVGRSVLLPLMDRGIPIIADKYVDPNFGTGAVKITPAHDPNDFEISRRHRLESIQVIDEDGKMTRDAKQYAGIGRDECRRKVVEDLESEGLLEKIEDYDLSVGRCYRCNTPLEPLVSQQWYLKTKRMAKKAIKATLKNRVSFIPTRWAKPYVTWLENLHDWCISRQIWWGHRIPVWYCKANPSCPPIISVDKPKGCPKCGKEELIQDPDVLDTWFSSALWPFSTLGWPWKGEKKRGSDLDYYYPTSVLVTGHEILYLWVARMVMMGMTLIKDIPFQQVFIHGIVSDKRGKKMSKSLGNVIDPLEVIKRYGTDALRFTMAMGGIMGRDLQLSEENFISSRNFCNKIWNASRLIIANLEMPLEWVGFSMRSLTLADRWIISEYNILLDRVNRAQDEYNISEVARLFYDFIWSKFCDWYLEIAKIRMYSITKEKKMNYKINRKVLGQVLIYVWDGVLRALHPIMPFITEEIWQKFRRIRIDRDMLGESIMIATYPQCENDKISTESIDEMHMMMEVITTIRNIRSEMNIQPTRKIKVMLNRVDKDQERLFVEHSDYIELLAGVERIDIGGNLSKPAHSCVGIVRNVEIYVPLTGIIDIDREIGRLRKEITKVEVEIDRIDGKLKNENFINRAPRDVLDKVKNQYEEYIDRKKNLERNLADMKS